MMTTLTPYVAEETAYRREQLMRAWGHRDPARTPRHRRGDGPRGRRAAVPAPARRTVQPAR